MNELEICQTAGPPATIEELSQFLLIAPERASAMRAEIRAIQKAGLAAEVYLQKVREQQQLCELILDASVRMGDIAKSIPKAGGTRTDLVEPGDSAVPKLKSKVQTIQDLGFSKKQVQRFETLADNKDLVELEKIRAREEGRMPTRTNVIDMAQARKKFFERDMERIDTNSKIHQKFLDAIYAPVKLPDSCEVVSATMGATENNPHSDLSVLERAIQKLQEIQNLLRKEAYRHGKK